MNYYNYTYRGQEYIILLSPNKIYAIAIDTEAERATEVGITNAYKVTEEVLFDSILDACRRSGGENTHVMFEDSPHDTSNIITQEELNAVEERRNQHPGKRGRINQTNTSR